MEHIFLQYVGSVFLLVPGKTGVSYEHQYGGYNCNIKEIEGFIVPCGPRDDTYQKLFAEMCNGSANMQNVIDGIIGICPPDFSEIVIRLKDVYRDISEYDAMLPVIWNGRDCFLIWENCD